MSKNLLHINAIEGLLSQVNEHLDQVTPSYPLENVAKKQAISDINDFQVGPLHALRVLCEGDG